MLDTFVYITTAVLCFFFNDTATTEIYTLSLHDALPIWGASCTGSWRRNPVGWPLPGSSGTRVTHPPPPRRGRIAGRDRKSTRLNSSHANISYAVFCLKKK